MSAKSLYLKHTLFLILGLAVFSAASLLILRACEGFANETGTVIAEGVESALRKTIQAQLELDPGYNEISEPKLDAAMNAIKERLIDHLETPLVWPLEIIVVSNNQLNAVTLPGGLILIYSGLIRRAESAEEIAAVIAHELAHVQNGDIMRSLSRNLAIAGVLAAGGSISSSVLDEVIHTLTNNAFSRTAEEKADEFAVRLLTASGIRPKNLADIFRKIDPSSEKRSKSPMVTWLSTHEETAKRIQRVEEADRLFSVQEISFNIDWQEVIDELP